MSRNLRPVPRKSAKALSNSVRGEISRSSLQKDPAAAASDQKSTSVKRPVIRIERRVIRIKHRIVPKLTKYESKSLQYYVSSFGGTLPDEAENPHLAYLFQEPKGEKFGQYGGQVVRGPGDINKLPSRKVRNFDQWNSFLEKDGLPTTCQAEADAWYNAILGPDLPQAPAKITLKQKLLLRKDDASQIIPTLPSLGQFPREETPIHTTPVGASVPTEEEAPQNQMIPPPSSRKEISLEEFSIDTNPASPSLPTEGESPQNQTKKPRTPLPSKRPSSKDSSKEQMKTDSAADATSPVAKAPVNMKRKTAELMIAKMAKKQKTMAYTAKPIEAMAQFTPTKIADQQAQDMKDSSASTESLEKLQSWGISPNFYPSVNIKPSGMFAEPSSKGPMATPHWPWVTWNLLARSPNYTLPLHKIRELGIAWFPKLGDTKGQTLRAGLSRKEYFIPVGASEWRLRKLGEEMPTKKPGPSRGKKTAVRPAGKSARSDEDEEQADNIDELAQDHSEKAEIEVTASEKVEEQQA